MARFDFHKARFTDNRVKGLMSELIDILETETDPEVLRRVGTSLKLLGGSAMNKGHEIREKEQ